MMERMGDRESSKELAQETGIASSTPKFQRIELHPLDPRRGERIRKTIRNTAVAAIIGGGAIGGAACEAKPTPGGSNTPEPTRITTPVEPTRIPTIRPTERPTATLVPPTKTPEATPTSIFESQLSGKEKFMVALGGGAIGGPGELTPNMIRKANQAEILELATKLNEAVVEGQLPKTTKAENIIFTFGGIKSTGGAETVGAIVVGEGRLWQADSSGVRVWVESGASFCRNCSVVIEENKRFIVQEGKKLFRITGTDATGFVNKMIEVDAGGNPVVGGKEKTSLLINALPDAQTGSNILEIPANFLAIPEGMQLKYSGFFNPIVGFVEFKNPQGQNVAVWSPIEGKFITGSEQSIFEKIPTPEPKPTVEQVGVESKFFKAEFAKNYNVVVDNIPMDITIGLEDRITNRSLEPVKSFEPAQPDAIERVGKFYLQMCFMNYKKYNPGNDGLSFEQYENIVRNGGGEITIAGVDEAKSDNTRKREILKISPKKLSLIFAGGQLPVTLNALVSTYLGKNSEGLVIVTNFLDHAILSEIRNTDPKDWPFNFGAEFSTEVLSSLSIIGVAENNLLLGGNYMAGGKFSIGETRPYRLEYYSRSQQTKVPEFWITQ